MPSGSITPISLICGSASAVLRSAALKRSTRGFWYFSRSTMAFMATSIAWTECEACSASEWVRLRMSRSPWASAVVRASTAFQINRPSTNMLMAATTAATIAVGENSFGSLAGLLDKSVGSTGVVSPPVINARS
ncbi:hypothetical protein [Bradyrhizobium pachyrhizi]|uniref:hypothetical protein n=1 Tax=Bradyrhizobium pachyrhizi TaxID=280333 RepID=UPI001FD478D8|nr:hypothetical protein [Bradyrhizobium pachyrhizi]